MKQKVAFPTLVLFALLATIVFSAACRPATSTRSTTALDEPAYKNEIQKWQSERLASLTKDDGWLTLVGLFWLNEGENKFGSDAKNAVVLPKGKAPSVAGSLLLVKGHVRLAARTGVEMTADNKPVTALDLKDDNDDNGPTILKLGTLLINVIKRGDRIGVQG